MIIHKCDVCEKEFDPGYGIKVRVPWRSGCGGGTNVFDVCDQCAEIHFCPIGGGHEFRLKKFLKWWAKCFQTKSKS